MIDLFNLQLPNLRRLSFGAGLLAIELMALWVAFLTHKPRNFTLALGLIAVSSLIAWVHHRRRYRLLSDTPVARIASAPQGYVEIAGHAQALDDGSLICPGTGMQCVWYRVDIAELQSGANNRESYVHQQTLESDHGFLISDGSGRCLIDPDAAEITTEKTVTHDGKQRYTAWTIRAGDAIYALGEFVSVRDQPADFRLSVSLKLADWKRDQHDLLRRFDTDRNGQIDPQEWDKARSAAEAEVSQEIAELQNTTPTNVMRACQDGRPFLVATEDPATGARRHRIWSWVHLALVVLGLHFMLYLPRHPHLIPSVYQVGPVTLYAPAADDDNP